MLLPQLRGPNNFKLAFKNRLEPATELVEILSVPIGTSLYENTRLFRRYGHATFLEIEVVIADRCGGLLTNKADQQRAHLAQQRYSPYGDKVDIVIRRRALDPDESRVLGLIALSGWNRTRAIGT